MQFCERKNVSKMTILDEVLIYIDDRQPVDRLEVFSFFGSNQRAVIGSAIARLFLRKDIQNNSNRQLICTDQGNRKIIDMLDELAVIRTHPVKSWYLCIFAIPEKSKVSREKLRLQLKLFGFGKLRGGLFIAYRSTTELIITFIKQENLQNYVTLIHVDHLPETIIQQSSPTAWPWNEFTLQYRALVTDMNEFLQEHHRFDSVRKKILAKLLVYRLAEFIRKFPQIENPFLPIESLLPEIKKYYNSIKPFCYS